MGSSGSKAYGASSSSSSSSGSGRKGRSKGRRVFQSSCLGSPSGSRDGNNDDHAFDHGSKDSGGNASYANQRETVSDQVKTGCYRKVKVEQSDEIPCISSNVELDEWSRASMANTTSRTASSSVGAASAQSFSSPSRFLSRFNFVPGNVSLRLSRATSLGSSMAYPVPSRSLRLLNDEEIHHRPRSANGTVHLDQTRGSIDLLPTSLISRIPPECQEVTSASFRLHGQASELLDNMQDNPDISPSRDGASNVSGTRVGVNENLHSPRIFSALDSSGTILSDRQVGAQEPVDRNVRFSRTLSVGRLRDRVLRRSSLHELTFCPGQQEREVRSAGHGSGRHALADETRMSESEGNAATSPTTSAYPTSGMSNSLVSIQDHEVAALRSREARYHDLLEHGSNFLERRRRIRSQVRALRRLGSRFENLSGHERSCIFSGQHRMGHCTCHASNRDANLNDDTSARASISRIVMLAEALFEVLDEIHQQSVVLYSQPSVSSLGSVPAPNEVVESLPLKLYSKFQKQQNDEAAQCYICLVEYEEGDSMRVLPCHHYFHRTCIDKWLKEIHRVCPLCRGDICRSDSLLIGN